MSKHFGMPELAAFAFTLTAWGFSFHGLGWITYLVSFVLWAGGILAVLNHFNVLKVDFKKSDFTIGTFSGISTKVDLIWISAPLLILLGLAVPRIFASPGLGKILFFGLSIALGVVLYRLYVLYISETWPEAEAAPATATAPAPDAGVVRLCDPVTDPNTTSTPRRAAGGKASKI